MASSTPPESTTTRPPRRSETYPEANEPTPMTIQLSSAIVPTLARDQPIDVSSGCWNTARVNRVPMAIVMMTKAAPSTTQP